MNDQLNGKDTTIIPINLTFFVRKIFKRWTSHNLLLQHFQHLFCNHKTAVDKEFLFFLLPLSVTLEAINDVVEQLHEGFKISNQKLIAVAELQSPKQSE